MSWAERRSFLNQFLNVVTRRIPLFKCVAARYLLLKYLGEMITLFVCLTDAIIHF